VAQLGARLDGIEEVVGSNPIGSTKITLCQAAHPKLRCRDDYFTCRILSPSVLVPALE
jgi:hypothetical protein